MKRMILTMVAMIMMITSVSAQRIDNANMEALILTDKMTEELGLNSWRQNTYVHNIYAKYPSKKSSFGGNRANKPVTLPAPANQRPVEAGCPHQPNYTAYNKNHGKPNRTGSTNTSNRSFGSMRR